MEEIKSWAVNIAAVAVLMIILDLIMPEGRIRKFTQLLTGFVLMFVMINPVLGLFGKGVPASFAGWSDESFLLSSQVKSMTGSLQDERKKQTLELYRRMLLADIQNRLVGHEQIHEAEVDAVLNENMDSENYGQIRRLFINLTLKKNETINKQMIGASIHKELQQIFNLKENEIVIQISEGE
ncbi:MAG: stage III sporulation protein AF [Clostridiaceae bacterium]|jgi:stage III sporulation protein AF|nr:stage III sporulation protein AF [Clostridiaceae bacterium]